MMIQRQIGASLIITLVMLALTMMLGAAAAQIALFGEKAARNDRDRQIAFQAAEAGLLDAETDIQNATGTQSRSARFSQDSRDGFPDEGESVCASAGQRRGLCRDDAALPAWAVADFLETASGDSMTVPYGAFTGKTLPVSQGILPARLPRYIIELKLYNRGGASADEVRYFYRITAVGFGIHDSTRVMLQSFYRKES